MLLETKYLDVVTFPGLQTRPADPPPGWKPVSGQIMDYLISSDEATLSAIRTAVEAIEKELPS